MTAPSTDGAPVTLLPRAAHEHPLTRTQHLVWSSQRLHPTAPLANMGKVHRIRGRLDPDRLARAFAHVVEASDALRTVIADTPGRAPVARVLAGVPASTDVIELAVDELATWCDERIAAPLDATVCGYDSVVLRHADEDWTWWLDLHHVVTDAASSALVFERTAAVYAALGEGHDPGEALGDLVPFYDHVDDLDARHAEGRAERAAWWTQQCSDEAPPTPYGPVGRRTTAVRRVPVEADADLDTALSGPYRTISRELGLLALLSTVTASLVSRLDGRTTVVLGVPIHHRSGRAAGCVIGPLMELYPLRVDVEPRESFAASFARVHRELVGVLRRAKPGESPDSRYDAVVNVLTARFGDLGGLPTETTWARGGHVDPAHPVRVQVYDYGDGLRLELDLNDGLSQDGAHRRMADHLGALLCAAIDDPQRSAADVELVTPDELAVLRSLNPPAPEASHPPLVHEAIAERLRGAPEHVTAECGGLRLTAGELDRRADALAAWLQHRGIERGDRVGVRMDRSLDVLVAIHGVLRAGAAFVVLDPGEPGTRYDAIVADADVSVVLDVLPDLDADPDGGVTPNGVAVGPDDLAYVLYTSGSTGAPKGVPISHRGLADYLGFAVRTYASGPPPVMALHSSLVFDLTITSLFLPQLTGGRTIVVPGDPLVALAEVARRSDLTMLKATPSQLELLTRMIDEPLGLEVVVVGGEAFRRPVAMAFAERCRPGVRIFNEYGPTEAVVGCMIHEWNPTVDLGPDVPIGTASPGAEVLVLDRDGRTAPVGSWGELLVRRPGMATGYLNLPRLSAERFVVVPGHGDGPWYRTGDRVRVADGVLVYGGREDDQLKVAGVRLEPGEIEAALVRHPEVSNAVVRLWSPGTARVRRCGRCGLGTDVPGVRIDHDGVCSICREYERVEPRTRSWFKTPDDLERERLAARDAAAGDFDCLHLLSGGKDSTYALYRLVEQGWRVHALTLDNGYIADGAKENIARTVADLGVSHEFVSTEAMAAIFRDSLERFANVCNGCYKTIYTLATARAHELGIPVIVTGLSRGQFFETRLVPHQFEADRFDPEAIDRTVLQARRAYHRTTDAVTTLLPEQRVFDDLSILDEIRYVDFYRYVDVELTEMYRFLEERAPWVRPSDTGRSTNCLINVAGIHVHRTERGYHNYAEPYSWDVRLGHKQRDEALDELDDDIDVAEVGRLLDEIGYQPKRPELLTAWYQTPHGRPLDATLLRSHLRELLPARSIPVAYVHVDDLPLADSAKLDVGSLPPPSRLHAGSASYVPPATPTEAVAADVWAAVLEVDRVGTADDFFDLGGSSLPALEVIAAMEEALGIDLPDALVFQHRVLRDFAAAVDELTGAGETAAPIPPLPPDQRPLSPTEASLLFECRMDPGDTRYNVTRLYTVAGILDLDRLREVLATVVARHASLHTAFDADRTILPPHAACTVEPMPAGPVDEFATRQRQVPFDLQHGPLVRVHVGHRFDRAGGVTHLLIGMHHLSVDAGTFDTFWNELDATWHGRPVPEPATSIAAHGAWQRGRWERAIEYWDRAAARDERAGDVVLPSPPAPEPDGYLEIDAPVTVGELATAATTTPFAAALAAAATVLGAHGRSGDVELGITASTKDHPDVDPLVGYFLNTLPMLLHVDRHASLRELDRRAGELVAEALPHRTLPLADIVERQRRLGRRAPDVRHMLAYERLAPARWGDGAAEHRILASGTSVSDLTFFVQERGDLLRLGVEFRGTVIGEEDAGRLLAAFANAIGTICHFPHHTADEVMSGLAGDDAVGAELEERPATVIERFVTIAADSPDRVAIVDRAGATTTYGALLERAGRLAAAIDAVAARPRRVGVSVRRSSAMIESILAAQLTGAAYVPLDPDTPEQRLALLTRSADLDVVVVDAATRHRHPTDATVDVAAADLDVRPLVRVPDPASDAYVIFTSGSTGEPAGVAVTHANLAASTAARSKHYGAEPPERFLLTSSIGFDSSVVGLTWPLATGGAIVLPGDHDVHDVDRLGDLIDARRVTHLLMVPSLYRALLHRRADRLGSLRTAIVAGEACPPTLAELHHRLLPDVELVNEYGPTEATVWAAVHDVRPGDDPVPIGRPIAGVTLRVADELLRPVGRGAPGELLVAGPGVTSGYVSGRSDDAFVEVDGMRWYRTGDLVRTDRRGRLLFLGRIDDQLNVGGARIEPAELERYLTEVPGVADAVVVVTEVDGREALVAHLQVDTADFDPDVARRHVAGRVVAAAVPRRFVVHDALPRTTHGKIDRPAAAGLPVGAASGPGSAGDVGLDRIVEIWRSVLGRPDLGADADFFAQGGDSLAAVEIVTRVGELVDREVPISTLLTAPTPSAMSSTLDWSPESAPPVQLVTMRPGRPDGPVVIMTAAWDDVQGYRELADAMPDHVTVVAAVVIDRSGALDDVDAVVDAIAPRLGGLVARESVGVVGWSIGGVVAFELGQRLASDGVAVGVVGLVDTYFPGEQRHLWSNRWWKYKSMLRPGALGAARREAAISFRRRAAGIAARLGRRLLAWSGEEVPPPAETTPGGIPFAATEHRPSPGPAPVTLYAASTTNPDRTIVPWRRIDPDLRVVGVAGRHRGHDSIMGRDRVRSIADDLVDRLPR